jgi:hypothetical protein
MLRGVVARSRALFGFLALACGHARHDPDGSPTPKLRHVSDWDGLQLALEGAPPGTTIVVHGRIELEAQVHATASGREDAWITIMGEPGVLDASRMPIAAPGGPGPWPHDDGAITLRGVHHVAVRDLTIVESPSQGISIHDSTDIVVAGNRVDHSFGSGIAAWDSDHREGGCERVKILGNVVRRANDVELAPEWFDRQREPPHEAISIGGAVDFEVAFNEVADTRKEGIDVKETSARGRVHHNWVHDAARQCYYVDAWFGLLHDIEVDHNVGERCAGAGFAISVEGKDDSAIERLEIHDNILQGNQGSGVLFGLWGKNGPRREISIHHNTIERNGHGEPNAGHEYFWITGGVFMLSASIEALDVRANRIVDNRGFQIGVSDRWGSDAGAAFATKRVTFADNDVRGEQAQTPIDVGDGDGERAAKVAEWPVAAIAANAAKAAGARMDAADVGPAAWRPDKM